jgi:shikimate kinase
MNPGSPIYLVGFMGSGKSAVGRLLAERRGWRFADTDRLVEEDAGRPIERIFEEKGETWFRDREWSVLQGLRDPRLVVATGGGLFAAARARRFMGRHGVTVWLDARLERVRGRIPGGTGRPLWAGKDPVALRELFERRRAVYALARLRVPADGPAEAVAAEADRLISLVFR